MSHGKIMSGSEGSGTTAIGKALHSFNEFIFVKNKKITSIVSIFVIIGLTFLVFKAEADAKASEMLGAEKIRELLRSGGFGGDNLFPGVEGFVERQTQSNVAYTVSEGQRAPEISINNTEEKVLKSIEIDMTWIDENDPPGIPRVREYENQPDEFSVMVRSKNGTVLINERSDTGSISGSYDLSSEEMEGSFGQGDFIISVTLESAGDWTPRLGPGIIQITDNENAFEMSIKMVHLEPESEE